MKKTFTFYVLFIFLLIHFKNSSAQCTILDDAIEGISYTYLLPDGTNASGVAYNPNFNIYYAVIAGNAIFPMETFDPTGTSLYQTNAGFDFRGLWWNPNTSQLEGNGYYTYGLWASNLDINGYALNTGTSLFTGQNQPTDQSCGDYDYDADEIVYYNNGSISRYDRATDNFVASYALTGIPVPISYINSTSVIYTGCCGNEIGLEDYVDKTILLFNKTTGAYSGSSQLPSSAITDGSFHFSYANNLVWLYDVNGRTWTSYSIFSGTPGNSSVNLGNDTSLCIGTTLLLSAGSSGLEYLWSTGSTDSIITVNSAGTYWLTVTNGLCVNSDTILISDTLCSPPIAFISSDTLICEKFCVNFFDSSTNNPTSWQWTFEGASPPTSTSQNPTNICYNDPGSYDVTLITTTSTGNDTLTLQNYITVVQTPSLPTITQNGYVLTASTANAYQWQLNLTDIPGATDQSYTVTQTGLYTVIIYDANGCKNSASLYVQIVGINEVNAGMDFSIFPNPNAGSFTIESTSALADKNVSIFVENSLGQVVYSSKEKIQSASWKKEIHLGEMSSGIYFLEIMMEGNTERTKFIISK